MIGSANRNRPGALPIRAKVTRVLEPDGSNVHVVVEGAPEVAFQAKRRLGSYSVTSCVLRRRAILLWVAKVVPTPNCPVEVWCAARWPEMYVGPCSTSDRYAKTSSTGRWMTSVRSTVIMPLNSYLWRTRNEGGPVQRHLELVGTQKRRSEGSGAKCGLSLSRQGPGSARSQSCTA